MNAGRGHDRVIAAVAAGVWLAAPGALMARAHAEPVREAIERGNTLYRKGEYAAALRAYDGVGGSGAARPEVLYNRACAEAALGDLAAAARLFRQVDGSGADAAVAAASRFNLGAIEYRRGKAAAEKEPREALGALQRSERFFRGALELNPTDGEAPGHIERVQRDIKDLMDRIQEQAQRQQQQGQKRDKDQQQQDQQNTQQQDKQDQQQKEQNKQEGADSKQEGQDKPKPERADQSKQPSDQQDQAKQPDQQKDQQKQDSPQSPPKQGQDQRKSQTPQQQEEQQQKEQQAQGAQQPQGQPPGPSPQAGPHRDLTVAQILEKERRERDARERLMRLRRARGTGSGVLKDW